MRKSGGPLETLTGTQAGEAPRDMVEVILFSTGKGEVQPPVPTFSLSFLVGRASP